MFLFWHETRKTKPWTEWVVWVHLSKAGGAVGGGLWNQQVIWWFPILQLIRFSSSVSFLIPLGFWVQGKKGVLQWKPARERRWGETKDLVQGRHLPGCCVERDDGLNTATFWLWPRQGRCAEEILPGFLITRAGHLAKACLRANPTLKRFQLLICRTAHASARHGGTT